MTCHAPRGPRGWPSGPALTGRCLQRLSKRLGPQVPRQ